ncbi:DUF3618 domain-containing protein [Bradyrhizobium sp. USDA 4454]
MTRSVDELRRESERSRAELAVTVDRLRERISGTAEDLRHKVSPQHIKSEVSGYISDKTTSWVEALKQYAMENPMQAVAAGTAVTVPLLRLARGFPLPLLMIGAGLALTSKTVRDRAAEAAAPVMEKAGGMFDQAGDGFVSAPRQTSGMAEEVQDAVSSTTDDLRRRAAQATGTLGDKLKSGMDAVKDKADAAKDAATVAPAKARQVIGDNAALIGGLGIAIGAILAAALPKTKAEAKAMGPASDSVRRAAGEAAQSRFEAAKEATMSAADAAARSVGEADLGGHASRVTENLSERLKEAADDVVRAAFTPSPNPNS